MRNRPHIPNGGVVIAITLPRKTSKKNPPAHAAHRRRAAFCSGTAAACTGGAYRAVALMAQRSRLRKAWHPQLTSLGMPVRINLRFGDLSNAHRMVVD